MKPFSGSNEQGLTGKGGKYTKGDPWTSHVVVAEGGKLITGQNPQSAEAFAEGELARFQLVPAGDGEWLDLRARAERLGAQFSTGCDGGPCSVGGEGVWVERATLVQAMSDAATLPRRGALALVPADGPRLRPEYVDLSDLNIHVVWETTILLWVERLPWLKERAPPDFAERVTKSLTKSFTCARRCSSQWRHCGAAAPWRSC